jgi:hypothetical protein
MHRSAAFRIAVLLIVALLFAGSTLQAAPRRADAEPGRTAAAAPAWDLLVQVWDFFTGIWSNNGCEVDPDGRCAPGPALPQIDNGCEADPNGHCGA